MWALVDQQGRKTPVKDQDTLIVSRKVFPDIVTLTLDDDRSISKKHALITANGQSLTIIDTGSKYGTYLLEDTGEKKITEYVALHNDRIKFGTQDSIYTVTNRSILGYKVLPTSISASQKKKLREILGQLGSEVIEEFSSECTHVTTNAGDLTEKVGCALAAAIPIVNLEFWSQYLLCLEKNDPAPEIEHFLPVLDKVIIDNDKALLPNPERKHIFDGKTFVFFSASQLKLYVKMVNLAGGRSVINSDPLVKTTSNMIFVQPSKDDEIPIEFTRVQKQLRIKCKRAISDSEIPRAILRCSLEMYCNPLYNWAEILCPAKPVDQGSILAPETQTQDVNSVLGRGDQVIPETISESQWSQNSKKTSPKIPIKAGTGRSSLDLTLPDNNELETEALDDRSDSEDISESLKSRKRRAAALDSTDEDSPSCESTETSQPMKKAKEANNSDSKSIKRNPLAALFKRNPLSRMVKVEDDMGKKVKHEKRNREELKKQENADSSNLKAKLTKEDSPEPSDIRVNMDVTADYSTTENSKSSNVKPSQTSKPDLECDTSEKKIVKNPFKKAIPRRTIPNENSTLRTLDTSIPSTSRGSSLKHLDQLRPEQILIKRNINPIAAPARRLTVKDMYVWVPKAKQLH